MQSLSRWAMAALSVVMCCASPIAQAAPGDLDPSFGVNGLATTTEVATFMGVAIQPDGKIVGVGEGGGGYSSAPFLVRYNSDGTPDGSFGSGGIVQTYPFDNWTSAIAVQADGKILTALYSSVVRYSASGVLETTFPNDLQPCSYDRGGCITSIVIQPDGKILATTSAGLVRYNSDGTYDSSFGNSGIAPLGLPYRDMTLQSDGKIVVVSNIVSGSGLVVRYNADGTADSTFGSNGAVVTASRDFNTGAYGVSVQTDGKIIFVSTDYNRPVAPHSASVLTRLNTDGTLDSSFGSSGIVETPISNNAFANAVRLQSDGKILVAGQDQGIYLARYNTDGSLDTQFGSSGVVETLGGTGQAIALQPDGKILVAGGGATVARYMADNSPLLYPTPVGNNVNVALGNGVTVAFSSVTTAGSTSVVASGTGPTPPAGFQLGTPPLYYDIQTTAIYTPPVTVCINYNPADYADPNLARLFHYESAAWTDVTTSNDILNGIICGQTTSLSPFAIMVPPPFQAQIQQPINSDGSSVFAANRGVVPVKFTLSSGGQSTCALPTATIAVYRTGGTTDQPITESVYSMAADNGSYFRISGCQYLYNLNSKALGKGTYLVQILINNAVVGSTTFGLK